MFDNYKRVGLRPMENEDNSASLTDKYAETEEGKVEEEVDSGADSGGGKEGNDADCVGGKSGARGGSDGAGAAY